MSRHENRRIPASNTGGSRDVLRAQDLDGDLLVLDRGGRVTLNLDRLSRVLKVPSAVVQATPEEIATFGGAGTTGLVPDPLVEASTFLKDDGTWDTPAGSGGAPTTAQYVTMALDATLSAERVLTAGSAISLTDGGANGPVTVAVPDAAITNAKLANMANGTYKARITAGSGAPEDIPLSGTVFPTSPAPIDGQHFYRTDHKTAYIWDAAKAAWLSIEIHRLEYGDTAAVAAGIFFRFGQNSGFPKYSATVGHIFPYTVICVGMMWRSNVNPANTITAMTTADGANVTGASMAVATNKKTRSDLASNTIAAEAVIGFKNSSGLTTGTLTVNGAALFRRLAT